LGRRRRAWNEIRTPVFRFDDGEGATTSRKVREVSESPWQSYSAAAPDREYVALLSYLPLNSAWRIPWLVLYSTRIRRQLSASPGLIGYSLRAQVAAKRFWTLSAWEDAAALQAFVAGPPHVVIMKALAPYMGATRFVRWDVKGSELPLTWDDALRRDTLFLAQDGQAAGVAPGSTAK
jgi:quinol monooxygenase YgiN